MHIFFTSQGDITNFELESSSLFGILLETLPHIFILFHFHLNYIEHILKLLFQLKLDKDCQTMQKKRNLSIQGKKVGHSDF